jgi:mRNA interferase MazF
VEYIKDFNYWNKFKQALNKSEVTFYAHPREIWWCSLGVNIGAEIDGKEFNFERPVILLKVYNKETILTLPAVSKGSDARFHFTLKSFQIPMHIRLTQPRVLSSKRLIRKIATLEEKEFKSLLSAFKDSI